MMIFLQKGLYTLKLTEHETGKGIGLFPTNGKVDLVKTEGLEWDVNSSLDVYGLFSACN